MKLKNHSEEWFFLVRNYYIETATAPEVAAVAFCAAVGVLGAGVGDGAALEDEPPPPPHAVKPNTTKAAKAYISFFILAVYCAYCFWQTPVSGICPLPELRVPVKSA